MKDYSDRIGQRRLMNCGFECEIIDYASYTDVTVKFDDGAVVRSTSDAFNYRYIRHPNTPRTEKGYWAGMKYLLRDGRVATVTRFRTSRDMDISYNDGTKCSGVVWNDFVNTVDSSFSSNKEHIPVSEAKVAGRAKKQVRRLSSILLFDYSYKGVDYYRSIEENGVRFGTLEELKSC